MWHDADRNRLFFPQELRTHIAVALKMSNIGRCRPVVRDGARRKELRSSEKKAHGLCPSLGQTCCASLVMAGFHLASKFVDNIS